MSTDGEIYCRYWPTLMYQSYLICRFLSIAFMETSEMVQAFTCSKIGKQHQAKRRPVWPNTMILKLVTITFSNKICNSTDNWRDSATLHGKVTSRTTTTNKQIIFFLTIACDPASVFSLKVHFNCNFPSVNKIEAMYGRSHVRQQWKSKKLFEVGPRQRKLQ